LRHEFVPRLARMLKCAREERELFSPAASRLAPPNERMKRVELAFVVPRFAFYTHRFERAVEPPRIVEQRISRPDWYEERGKGAVRMLSPFEDVKRVGEIELAGERGMKRSDVRLVHAF
jgi:hypothetical protein